MYGNVDSDAVGGATRLLTIPEQVFNVIFGPKYFNKSGILMTFEYDHLVRLFEFLKYCRPTDSVLFRLPTRNCHNVTVVDRPINYFRR